jgi:hypothetical protein
MAHENLDAEPRSTGLAFRVILSFFAGLFGVVMFLIAPEAVKPISHYLFGAFCIAIAVVSFVSGRIQRAIGSLIASVVLALTAWYLVSELFGGPVASGARSNTSVLSAVFAFAAFGLPALLYLRHARFGFGAAPPVEEIQVDSTGVSRAIGSLAERIRWDDVDEIRVITTDSGPFAEDVFFLLVDVDKKGCLVPHYAAVRHKLLEQLQSRFEGLDDAAIVKAMASTSNADFLVWKKPQHAIT